MNSFKRNSFVLCALLMGALIWLAGCATTGTKLATKTTNTMQTVETDYRQAALQIDATRASLEDLMNPGQTDMQTAFKAYTRNVEKMESIGKQLDNHSQKMTARGNDYFAEWEKQGSTYTNPQIRELSEQRRMELRDVYLKVPEASIGVRGNMNAYLADIRDIQKYLSNDLTPQGVQAIKPIAERAVKDGENLRESVRPVLAAIERAKTEMAQGGMSTGSGAAAGGEGNGTDKKMEETTNP
ncbi:MAG: hypothetical protein A2079_00360 [Geobacteraceae bacterium GWC2_48_7]|nr:MAG: hypothetical protein A2079_00360 [Geobacteraceae bacterium GWC2_48_7]